ncbi:hypothetical protein MW887_009456 [Aspergillus wentii]|nr:hypothetical protein MW887_009456 [Aspergillus wentii]
MPVSIQTNKLVSTLRLLIPRLRLLQKKDTASSVVQRRELASLLDENRDASARIRVENVIATDTGVEVMEMVELYCELLLARANVLDQLAFGERGGRARNRAREVAKEMSRRAASGGAAAANANANARQAEEKKNSSILGFPFSLSSKKPSGGEAAEERRDDTDDDDSYMDSALDEAAAAVFYAWSRFPHDVRELNMLRSQLTDRYGKDFMTLAQDNKIEGVSVPERLVKGLRVRPPTQELVDLYLREIAHAYGVVWPKGGGGDEVEPDLGDAPPEFLDQRHDDDYHGGDGDGDGDGDNTTSNLPSTPRKQTDTTRPTLSEARRASEASELNKVTPPRGLHSGKSPVSVAPPGPRTDNPSPRVKLPGSDETGGQVGGGEAKPKNNSGSGGIPELDELTRRFAALRR